MNAFPDKSNSSTTVKLEYEGLLLKVSQKQLEYLKTRDEALLGQIASFERRILKLASPMVLSGDASVNELMQNKMEQEKILSELQLKGIQQPEKLNVLRFYTMIFNKKKKE